MVRAETPSPAAGVPDPSSEALDKLTELAHGKTRSIEPSLIARHVLRVAEGGDWPLRRGALEALLRRFQSIESEELVIAARPTGRQIFGLYQTRRKGRRNGARPYSTLLRRIDPLSGSCDCPDYQKSSLGLCKHLLCVLDDLFRRPQKRIQAVKQQEKFDPPVVQLWWDPVRDLTGPGDWLDQIHLERNNGTSTLPASLRRLEQWFGKNGTASTLRSMAANQPKKRLHVVEGLREAMSSAAYRRIDPHPDPALGPLLEQERNALRRKLRDLTKSKKIDQELKSLKHKLYPYQIEGVKKFLGSGRILLADDMGLGKTAQAIAMAHIVSKRGAAKRGLVIVPASLKHQWKREWTRFSDVPVTVLDGGPSERHDLYEQTKRGFLVANYELVLRDLRQMREFGPEMIILDEAQRIKNWATKTATYVKTFNVPYRVVLTGTPMENRLDELGSIMDWVDERAIEPKWRLGPWHTAHSGDAAGGIASARNLDTLRTRLDGTMLRRIRQDVLKQLPKKTDTRVPVEMTGEQAVAHDELEMPIAQLLRIRRKRPLLRREFLRLMQLLTTQRIISNGMAQLEFEDVWPTLARESRPTRNLLEGLRSPKLIELRNLIESIVLDQGRKVVIFSQWRRMLRLANWAIQDLLRKADARSVFFTGAESARLRDKSLVEFHDDPQTMAMFLSDAGGVGLNLQKAATCCINLELPWNPAVLEQRIGRIYRLGQKHPIDVYNLMTETGIETRIARTVAGKQALFKGLFDGTSDEIAFESGGSFLDTFEQIFEAPVEIDEIAAQESSAPDEVPITERELDELVDAADESRDLEPSKSGTDKPVVARPEDGASHPTNGDGAALGELFAQMRVEKTASGGLRIETPAEAASVLAGAFEGMAKLLRAQGS